MAKEEKTNVMRLLEAAKIPYTSHSYDPAVTDGRQVAKLLGEDPDATFKTLVTVSDSKKYYVFVVPVNRELDLKACARAAGEKSIAMIKQKELFPLTGYLHGGCSPIGMKKQFPCFFDSACEGLDSITCSAGKVGRQVTVPLKEFLSLCKAKIAAFSREINERSQSSS